MGVYTYSPALGDYSGMGIHTYNPAPEDLSVGLGVSEFTNKPGGGTCL